MVIGDYFQLEGALQGRWVAKLAADEEERLPVGVFLGRPADIGLVVENRLDGAGERLDRLEQLGCLVGRQGVAVLADGDRKEGERRDLGDERLRGSSRGN